MKKAIFGMLLLLTLLVGACTTTNTNTGTTGFIGGSKGIDISFYTNAPPATTPDGGQQEFDVIVDIQNQGEDSVEINEAFVKLSGFPPEAFGLTMEDLILHPEEKIEANIKSSDGTIIKSTPVPVSFTGFNYMDTEVASREFPIWAEICYTYTTKASAELCIKENFNSNEQNDLCQVTAERKFSTSGAPIQITSIKQSTAGTDKTRFTFTIQNIDSGEVYKLASACSDQLVDENKVFVKIDGLTGNEVRCVGLNGGTPDAGYVTLTPGTSRDVSCTVTVLERNDRIEPFEIELSYDYSKIAQTKILIEHTPQ